MVLKTAKYRIIIFNTNKQLRIDFCKDMLAKSDEYLNSIFFSDETKTTTSNTRQNERLYAWNLG